MGRKLLILSLALMVIFAFSVMPAAAASKQIVEVRSESTTFNESGGIDESSITKNTYNKGKLTRTITTSKYIDENDDGEPYEATSIGECTYKYNKKGLVTSKIEQIASSTDDPDPYKRKTTYKYSNGKLSKEVCYNYYDGSYHIFYKTTYTRKAKKVTAVTKGEAYDGKYIETLDNEGRVKKCHYYSDDGKLFSTETYTYWPNGNIKKHVEEFADYSDKTVENYNKKGLLTKEISTYEGGKEINTYKYNAKGLVTTEVRKSSGENDEGKMVTTTETYKYSYSNFYNNNKKYPKTIKVKLNGKLYQIEERKYKKI